MKQRRLFARFGSSAAVLCLLCGSAFGQDAGGGDGAASDPSERPLLAGPEVTPGPTRKALVGGEDRAMGIRGQTRLLERALRALADHNDASLRFTPAQRRAAQAEMDYFQLQTRLFERANAEVMSGLRREAALLRREMNRDETAARPEAGRGGGQAASGDAPRATDRMTDGPSTTDRPSMGGAEMGGPEMSDAGETSAEARLASLQARIVAVRADAPDPAGVVERVWGMLSEPQRVFVESEMQAMVDAADAERTARETERYRRQYAAERVAMMRQVQDAIESGDYSRLPLRLQRRLERVPEAERPDALQRFLASYAERDADAGVAGRGEMMDRRRGMRDRGGATERDAAPVRNRRGQKPPPGMDDLDLPPPPPPRKDPDGNA